MSNKIGVSLKINTSQIDMARLFAGQKGSYLDATVFIELSELDQFGNSGMITQDVSKDEKAQGVKGNILGNCKVFWSENGQAPQQAQAMGMPQQANNQMQQMAPQQPQAMAQPQQMRQAPTLAQQQPQQQPQMAQPQGHGGFQQQPTQFDDGIPFNQPR